MLIVQDRDTGRQIFSQYRDQDTNASQTRGMNCRGYTIRQGSACRLVRLGSMDRESSRPPETDAAARCLFENSGHW